jgi:hypothetical protein
VQEILPNPHLLHEYELYYGREGKFYGFVTIVETERKE